MTWLFPSVTATLVGVLILCSAYLLIYFREKEPFLGLWSIGWLLYALRLLAMLFAIGVGNHPALLWANQAFALGSGLFLLWGTARFAGRQFSPGWLVAALAGVFWIAGAVLEGLSFFWTTLPGFVFQAAVYVWTGVVWLRDGAAPGPGRLLAGWAFILWGLHKLDYPFLRPLGQFAPWGYLLGASLAMVSALSILLVYFDKAHAQVAESERRLRMVADHLPVLLGEIGGDGRYRFANREHERWFGISPAEIEGLPVDAVIGDTALAEMRSGINTVLAGRPVTFEGRLRRFDGADCFYEARFVPRLDGDGRVAGSFVMALDMTRRQKAEAALTAAMERYSILLGSISDGFYSLDREMVITYFNAAAGRLLGREADEVVGRHLFDAFPEAQGSVFEEKFIESLREGTFQTFETFFRPAPYTNWYDVRVYPHDGGISVFFQVTTDRKAAETRLRESEERHRRMVEMANEGIWSLDCDGRTAFVNRKLTEMMGYPAEEMRGRCPTEFMLPEDRPAYHQRMQRRRRGEAEAYDCRFRRADGTTLWVHIAAAAELDDQGRFRGAMAMMTDITERVHTEQALRESERRLREAQRLGRIGAWEYDFVNRRMVWSEMTSELFGHDPNAGPPSPDQVAALLPAEDRRRLRRYTRRVIRNGTSATYDFRVEFPDAPPLFLAGFMRPVRDATGRVVRLVGAVQDITDRKRAEADKQAMERQLLQAQKMEAIGALAGGIAHDFNNILVAMTGFTELAAAELPADSLVRERLDQVLKAGERARELVRQILSFSRQAEQEQTPIYLNPVVKEVLGLLRATIPTTVDIRRELAPETDFVRADPTAIHQLLMNLCTNAAHAMCDTGGTLTVVLETVSLDEVAAGRLAVVGPGRYRLLSVRDTGPGIPAEDQLRIFEPFFTTKASGEGTGLGLSVVHGIVSAHGGEVTVDSTAGEGTTFSVYLPVVAGETKAEDGGETAAARGHAERVLLVDDDPAVAAFGREALAHLGYRVSMFADGADAWAAFRAAPADFDLLLTDQTMPGMTGLELAERVRQLRPEVPIILCTGYSSGVSEEAVAEGEIDRLLLKPFNMARLGEVLGEVLGGE